MKTPYIILPTPLFSNVTPRERKQWKGLVNMKIIYTPFFKTTHPVLPIFLFLWEKSEPPSPSSFIGKILKTQTNPLLYKGASSNYVI